METRSCKRRKLLMKVEQEAKNKVWVNLNDQADDIVDRISDLPNEILHQILSLLPIKSVAQASILSKRWRSLWTSLPDLDFTSTLMPNKSSFDMDFISDVLARRDKKSWMTRLRFCAKLSFRRLNGVIRSAISRNVQELDIEVATDGHFNLPRCILTSDSLRILKLKSCYPGFRFPPSSIMKKGFRTVNILSLSLVVFPKNTALLDLFTDASFPLLKKLSLDTCFDLQHIRFSSRALEELHLQNCYDLQSLEIATVKLDTLQVKSCFNANSENEQQVCINAPGLRKMVWEHNAIADTICFENLDGLYHASIGFFEFTDHVTAATLMGLSKLLAGVSHVPSLCLDRQCIEILSNNNNNCKASQFKPFCNLKSLEIQTGLSKSDLGGLACILMSAPFIDKLILTMNDHNVRKKGRSREPWSMLDLADDTFWQSQVRFLKSFLQHIQVVKICGFFWSEPEIALTVFLLKHARNLQKIMVLCSGYHNPKDIEKLRKFLKHCTEYAASATAQIEFQ